MAQQQACASDALVGRNNMSTTDALRISAELMGEQVLAGAAPDPGPDGDGSDMELRRHTRSSVWESPNTLSPAAKCRHDDGAEEQPPPSGPASPSMPASRRVLPDSLNPEPLARSES